MKLRGKVVMAFIMIIVLNAILGGIIYTDVDGTASNVNDLVDKTNPALQSVSELRTSFAEMIKNQELLYEMVGGLVDSVKSGEQNLEGTMSDLMITMSPIMGAYEDNVVEVKKADETLEAIEGTFDENFVALSGETKAMVDDSVLMLLIFSVVGAFIAILLALMLSTMISTPVRKLTAAANRIGEGDVDADIPEVKSKDEVRDLADAIETMRGAIRCMKKQ